MNSEAEMYRKWVSRAEDILLNKKIVKIRWMDESEANEGLGWHSRPVILILDDGTEVIPQRDDEGNDGGALLWINPNKTVEHPSFPGKSLPETEVLPVF